MRAGPPAPAADAAEDDLAVDGLSGPVLLVCADAVASARLLEGLYAAGIDVIGPASTAAVALTLAAQTWTPTALIAGETAGRRNAAELADSLESLWGVECCHMPLPQ